ncbi:hypothetical protein AB0F81_25170 [Actinoplanes sp. NPDC024001]|uniref:hypothetical protein n=1 Tax=Actinoplanes sp. NPDC024001 TaxID=3154598 RepID=UPI0033C9509A
MKIRRADKRYQARHGGTRADDVLHQATEIGKAVVLLAAFAVVGVTGYFLHDDVTDTARAVTGGNPAGMAAAGWLIVLASAGTTAGCFLAANRHGLRSPVILWGLVVCGAAAAFPALWLFPRRRDKDPFGWASDALVHGSQCAYVLIFFTVAAVFVSGALQSWLRVDPLWNRKWLLGTAGVVTAVAALTLAVAVAYA